VGAAQDADEIKAATLEHFAVLNAGDAAAHIQQHLPDASSFPVEMGLLEVSESREDQIASLQADFDAGLKTDLTVRDLTVKVYGDAAVVTGYVVGTATSPDGTTEEVTSRRSAFLIRQGGRWLEAHSHTSPLTTELPQ
jgi:ketosteroid isomerase-like protein